MDFDVQMYIEVVQGKRHINMIKLRDLLLRSIRTIQIYYYHWLLCTAMFNDNGHNLIFYNFKFETFEKKKEEKEQKQKL